MKILIGISYLLSIFFCLWATYYKMTGSEFNIVDIEIGSIIGTISLLLALQGEDGFTFLKNILFNCFTLLLLFLGNLHFLEIVLNKGVSSFNLTDLNFNIFYSSLNQLFIWNTVYYFVIFLIYNIVNPKTEISDLLDD